MWKLISFILLALMVQSVSAANLNTAQDKAVKAYLAIVNKDAAAIRESVEINESIVADLNADAKAEVILRTVRYGATYSSSALVIFSDQGKSYQLVTESTDALGQVESVEVKNGLIYVHALWPGPNDPRCCPTIKETAIYQLQGKKLVDVTNKKTIPAVTQSSTPSTPAMTQNVNAEWKFASIRGLKLAGITNGVTGLKALNVYCEGNIPTVAAAFTASQPNPVRVEIQIGNMIYPFVFAEQPNNGGYRLLNMSKSAFPKGLASGQQQAQVKINGVNYGVLSLRNAGTTSRTALSACYRY